MVAAITIRSPRKTQGDKKSSNYKNSSDAIHHAVRLIHAVCGLAGSPSLLDEIRSELRPEKVRAAIRNHNTAAVFDWLMASLSYQGISNQVAHDYMERHGRAAWDEIKRNLD